jgi:hypothetical protein
VKFLAQRTLGEQAVENQILIKIKVNTFFLLRTTQPFRENPELEFEFQQKVILKGSMHITFLLFSSLLSTLMK